jgi:RNA polymerase sigma-70 factor (ECF subfamily)
VSRTTAVTASEFSDVHAEVRSEPDLARADEEYARAGTGVGAGAGAGAGAGQEFSSVEPASAEESAELVAGHARPVSGNPDGSVTSSELNAMSDEELLAGIRAESELHFAELYNRYFQRIYSFVYKRMRNHAEAEEVVQETFLAVFRSFDRYRGQSSLLSWIYGIAKNTANSSIRRSRSLNERIDLADDEDLMPRPSLAVGTPAEQLDLHRFREQLTQRLEGLADWQTEIFEMRHFENLSIPEISRRTTRSSDAVRSSLYRVKRLFFEAAEASHAGGMVIGEQP